MTEQKPAQSSQSDEVYLIRTRLAGVFIDARILGRGRFPHEYIIWGRRLHFWPESDRLACRDLAEKGPPDGSRVEAGGEVTLSFPDTAERRVMSAAAIIQSASVPDWEP